MKKLDVDQLDDLAIGSAILGSGGGGDPFFDYMMTRFQIEKNGPVPLISFSDLKPDDVIAPIGMMGAPSAQKEKFANGTEFEKLFEVLADTLGKKVTVTMAFEVGGGNGFVPLTVASRLGLRVLDADTMGRAFPQAQMSTCNLFGVSCSPGFITDALGNTVSIYAENCYRLEKIGRQVAVAMGSAAAFCFYPFTADQARGCTIPKSITKAISIGKAHREARLNGQDPTQSILKLCKGVLIGSGTITDIDMQISNGFLNGKVVIRNKNDTIDVAFQNEYLVAKCNGKIEATTPDILTILEQETGAPVMSEALQYGLKVNLIALPAPSMWTTPAGLAIVGPRHFGYETDYSPISSRNSVHNQ